MRMMFSSRWGDESLTTGGLVAGAACATLVVAWAFADEDFDLRANNAMRVLQFGSDTPGIGRENNRQV